MSQDIFKKQNGFSLLGVILSVFICSMALVAFLSLIHSSLAAAELSRMRLTAAGLAQEGAEVTRSIRDRQEDWNAWYAAAASGDFRVQYDSDDFLAFAETPLRTNAAGVYQYDSGADSRFYRKVSLEKISADEIKVAVEMKWFAYKNWRYLRVEDRLWNWR
jgi:Tfp pilus assembly protein PilV